MTTNTTRRRRGRIGAGAAAVLLTMGATAVGPADAVPAAPGQGAPIKSRVRDLRPRVRDLESRWRALDNSERAVETAERTTVTFAADVLFEFDRADLTPAARTRLGELAGRLSGLGPRAVAVAGHTDSRGEPAYNEDLSLQRARSVEAALRERVGPGFTFEVSGHGETRPVAPNQRDDGSDDTAGRALNRRVDVSFPS